MVRNSALVVIDLQLGPFYGTHKQEETMAVIQSLISRAKEQKIPIFYIQHGEQPGGFLERGTPFWQLMQGIVPGENDYIIHKQSTDSFYETSLQQELENLNINHLIVAGARTEYCVDTTCRRAVSLGFDVTLVEDGHTTADGVIPEEQIILHHNHNLSTVKTVYHQIVVIPSDKVVFN